MSESGQQHIPNEKPHEHSLDYENLWSLGVGNGRHGALSIVNVSQICPQNPRLCLFKSSGSHLGDLSVKLHA